LLKTARATYDSQRPVHELVVLDGRAGYLAAPLIHYNYRDRAQFHRKQQVYSGYDAAALYQAGRRARPHNFILQPLREFRRRFVTLQGYRDGAHGLELAMLMMYYELVKYVKLWRMQRARAEAERVR
jgi:(heptosyl)LPS beta-1,4-glucosyltransferase